MRIRTPMNAVALSLLALVAKTARTKTDPRSLFYEDKCRAIQPSDLDCIIAQTKIIFGKNVRGALNFLLGAFDRTDRSYAVANGVTVESYIRGKLAP